MLLQPARCIVGLCPNCGRVTVITIDVGTWPLVECACTWRGGVDQLNQPHVAEHGELRPVKAA